MNADGAADRRHRYVDALRREYAIRDDVLAAAFEAVPREVFVADGFRTMEGRWVTAADSDFLTEVYRNDALVTKLDDGVPVSSSSQPSLMAIMLDALDLRPGMRVLEIGTGTGYNAALLAALGTSVTSVDVQPDVVDRAREALAGAGTDGVALVLADGYEGCPAGAPYDRIIVTVGVSGAAPGWFDQLGRDGFVLAPVFHAGGHPILRLHREPGGAVRGRGVCGAGFMIAAGPLGARYPWAHPEPMRSAALPPPTLRRRGRWYPPLDARRYHDLCFAAGAWHPRVTHGALRGEDGVDWVLLDETGRGGAAIAPDGAILATGAAARAYADQAAALLDHWDRVGAPAIEDWTVELTLAGDPDRPIWVPHRWHS
ncbi:MAG TPA: methyltransferase domain-containing protein [Pilimelia sp.]|nr:methyltransferase domain-containing protein [Pilimelia sp.]